MGSVDSLESLKTHIYFAIMRPIYCILAVALVAGTVSGQQRRGNRRGNGRRQGQRQGRQEDLATYAEEPQAGYGEPDVAADTLSESHEGDHQGLDWLLESVPGTPGDDYPILAEVPETAFGCEGQVEGGYYADAETECQAFHVCTADGQGGLSKYSFLCPNGTIFNQAYFICDWWFNFDCAEAEGLYSLNEDIAAERESIDAAAADSQGAASDAEESYAAPPLEEYGAEREGRQGRRQGGSRRQGRRNQG